MPLVVKMPTTTNLFDERSLYSSVADATDRWNAVLQTVHFTTTAGANSPAVAGNNLNELVLDSSVAGEAFPDNALAVTLHHINGNAIDETDIVFNSRETWDSYLGPLRPSVDIHRVALHELGHALGLKHPDDDGQTVTAIMNRYVSKIDELKPDDVQGAQRLYGGKNLVPGNDAFASAYDFGSTPSGEATGSNINGSREPGEPAHAGVATGHSIWWRFTPTQHLFVTLDTYYSDFDTVLAVYSGTALGNLRTIAANDDVQTPEQNPGPSRVRTSEVTFEATPGTTYYFAVDGWGDPDRFPAGSTGWMQLHYQSKPAPFAPAGLSDPRDASIQAEESVSFQATFDGYPAPTLQWQRRPAGATAWSDLVVDAVFTSVTGSPLTFRPTVAMSGDAFRCVATNLRGEAVSAAATLTVAPGQLPAVTLQPIDTTLHADEAGQLTAAFDRSTSYQWYHDGAAIPGATAATLDFPTPQAGDAGAYYVVGRNATGSVTSITVTVTANTPPQIINQRVLPHFLADGPPPPLAVKIIGTGAPHVQWFHNGRPIPGATQVTFQPTGSDRAIAGAYWARVTDDRGTSHGPAFFILAGPAHSRIHRWSREGGTSPSPGYVTDAIAGDLGSDTGLVLRRDSRVASWGPADITETTNLVVTDAVALAVGPRGAVLLHQDGTVTGTSDMKKVPAGLKNVVAIAAGQSFAVALRSDGTVAVWGGVSNSASIDHAPPDGLRDVVAIGAGINQILAVKADGTVVGWPGSARTVTPPAGLDRVVAVDGGYSHSVALRDDGTVVTWGDRKNGEVAGLTDVVAIAAGYYHTVALKADGSVVAWGERDGSDGQFTVPSAASPAFAIAAGSDSLALTAVTPDPSTQIVNLSVRSKAGTGDQKLVMGFVIVGDNTLGVLARGVGPTLAAYGVPNTVARPTLTLYNANRQSIAFNLSWWLSPTTPLLEVTATLGAFPLPPKSNDAALLTDLAPGLYSAHVESLDGVTGIALIELYDATRLGTTHFTNVSARTVVGTGDDVLVAGFVLQGEGSKTMLIRGVGPTLVDYGLPAGSVLANPRVQVFRGTEVIASNDDWAGDSTIKTAAAKLGAFPLAADQSLDAAVLVTLEPGPYTVQVSGINQTTGIALVEIYEVE